MTARTGDPSCPECAKLLIRVEEMDRRFNLSIDALTARVFQQFNSDHTALQAALMSQEKAVAAALQAAKEAVDKAETAASKRFDSTNEFRLQLSDQQATFVRQDVADARFAAAARQSDTQAQQISALQLSVATGVGRDTGTTDTRDDARAALNARYVLASVVIASLGLVLTVFLGTR
ncbi:hypothetical protein [Nocardia sp. NPDC049149]|uniref:hypothetical protein n=1 Tax=Nocardia sp. NPDC049149 TaxID=3364315 RepID=UPI00371573A3